MTKFTDEELKAAYEAHKDDSQDDLKKYLKSLPLAQQMQYNGYAEERRRENLSPEERKKEDRKAKIGCAIFLLIIIFCIATCGRSDEKPSEENKPAQTVEQQVETKTEKAEAPVPSVKETSNNETQKSEFTAFDNEVMKYLKVVDDNWGLLWQGSLQALSVGQKNRYDVYSNIDALEKNLEQVRDAILKIKVPESLNESQKDKLSKAKMDYITWIYCRREACDDMKKALDKNDLSPSKMNKIKENIATGDNAMLQATAQILDVKKELGILQNQ